MSYIVTFIIAKCEGNPGDITWVHCVSTFQVRQVPKDIPIFTVLRSAYIVIAIATMSNSEGEEPSCFIIFDIQLPWFHFC